MSVALVTGATRGVGVAIARRLAEEGHDVGVGYGSDAGAAERVAEELRGAGRSAAAAGGDLARPETAGEIVDAVERELGPIGVLIANAGINTPSRLVEEIPDEEWDRVHAVNLRAPFLLSRRLLSGMIERGFGRIVLISSVAAYTGGIIGAPMRRRRRGYTGSCTASRSRGWGAALRQRGGSGPDRDGHAARRPGAAREARALAAVGRLGRPEEVADIVAAVVRNGFVTNQSILVDGGRHPT